MREGTWEYEVVARCALSDAVALLSDVSRQGDLHPLVIKVVEVPAVEGALRSYAVTDQLQWGPLRFKITYHADQLAVSDSEIVTVVRQRPRTRLRITTRFEEQGDTVRIHVTVLMRAPTPLFAYAYRTGRDAHLQLADRIRTVLEGNHTATA
jgi:hypothetical protein